ncbi:uncharacterized protein LOC135495944 [Lineus longissimus]|uniref:uncharacterized protein LOC135495944 n=1 Tax=Lineus longissimus TaxID=88925 RepID=UPI002B4CEE4C
MMLSAVHLLSLVAIFCVVHVHGGYLSNGWYKIYEVCGGEKGCMKEVDWDSEGPGDKVSAQPMTNSTTSWFVNHRGGGKYSFSTSCSLDCNTWNAEDHIIKGTKVSYSNGAKTLFKLERTGNIYFQGDSEDKYKIIIATPENLDGNVVDIRSDGKLGYGNTDGQKRFVFKRNFSIVSGCNCSWFR